MTRSLSLFFVFGRCRMSQLEQKSLINALLNVLPDDVQLNLLDAISQLTNFLHDKADFPVKCIPVKSFPSNLKDIFHRFVSMEMSTDKYGRYSREQLITMDLVINPKRFSSWKSLLNTKINQMETVFNATDLLK